MIGSGIESGNEKNLDLSRIAIFAKKEAWWLIPADLLMSEKFDEMWQPTEKQVDEIIIPSMQGIANQCVGYINQLQCPPEFIAVMLRDIADEFEKEGTKRDSDCSCC